jgi:hypothetical protein
MSLEDCDEAPLKELEWLYGRLVKQKSDEKKALESPSEGQPVRGPAVWRKKYD